MPGGRADLLLAAAGLAACAGLGVLVARHLGAAWRWGAGLGRRRVVIGWAAVNAYCVLSLAWFGVPRDDPIVQLQAKHLYYNWQRSQDVLATVEAMDDSAVAAAARLAETVPLRRPDIYLFTVESYGAALWADEDYRVARRGLMRRVESELDRLQLPLLTRFAASPVYGGGSWMSTASALSGMRIGSHSHYWAVEAHGRPLSAPHLLPAAAGVLHAGRPARGDLGGRPVRLRRSDSSGTASSTTASSTDSAACRTSGRWSTPSRATGTGGRAPGCSISPPSPPTSRGNRRPGSRPTWRS